MNWIIGMLRFGEDGSSGVKEMKFFEHPKGWYVLRFKDRSNAMNVASCMSHACLNTWLVYNLQNGRDKEILSRGLDANIETGCCAPTVVRQCIIEGTGIDPDEFYTWSEVNVLEATGLFEPNFKFKSKKETPLEIGDILITQTAGTTAIVIKKEMKKGKK